MRPFSNRSLPSSLSSLRQTYATCTNRDSRRPSWFAKSRREMMTCTRFRIRRTAIMAGRIRERVRIRSAMRILLYTARRRDATDTRTITCTPSDLPATPHSRQQLRTPPSAPTPRHPSSSQHPVLPAPQNVFRRHFLQFPDRGGTLRVIPATMSRNSLNRRHRCKQNDNSGQGLQLLLTS